MVHTTHTGQKVLQIKTIHLKEDGLFHLPATINNYKTQFLFDTGASYTILDKRIFDAIPKMNKPQLRATEGKLFGASGDFLTIYGSFDAEVNIANTGIVLFRDCVVADLYYKGAIFGLREMLQLGTILDLKQGTMEFNGHTVALHFNEEDYPTTAVSDDDYSIPAAHSMFVNVHCTALPDDVPPKGHKVFSPTNNFTLPSGVFAPYTLVEANSTCFPVYVTNVTDKKYDIPKGTLLGILSLADSVTPLAENATGIYTARQMDTMLTLPDHLQPLIDGVHESCPKEGIDALESLLTDYQDVFVGPNNPLSRTHLVEHTIDTGDARPIKLPLRRQAMAKIDIIDDQITTMLDQGIIRPSNSSWAFREVLVDKKDGTPRFCVDYRRLNAITTKDAYPLPRLDDSLDGMGGAQWFCTLDLASGYWQVPMAEKDKGKTAFATRQGLFEYNVMPFGLTNAPATFERLMELVLRGMTWKQCQVYLDDVIVFGKTFEETLDNLEKTLYRLRKANLKLKPKKCSLFQTEVHFLGHIISKDGIKCDPQKLETIQKWPHPETVTQLKGFLGLCSYYRRFIKDLSTISAPLSAMTKKNQQPVWTPEAETAFQTLKKAMSSPSLLKYPRTQPKEANSENMEGVFILDTDASNYGIGAALAQIQDGKEVPLAFASKTLSKTQRRYCTTYKELFAVVEMAKHFKHYLYGQKVIVRTDHASLRWLLNFDKASGMLARWLAKIAMVNMIDITYRPGIKHTNADALSRRPGRNCPRDDCPHCRKYWKTPPLDNRESKEIPIRMANIATRKKNYGTTPQQREENTESSNDMEPDQRRSQRLASRSGPQRHFCPTCHALDCEHLAGEKDIISRPVEHRLREHRLEEQNSTTESTIQREAPDLENDMTTPNLDDTTNGDTDDHDLERQPIPTITNELVDTWFQGFTPEQLRKLQKDDKDIHELHLLLQEFEDKPTWQDVCNKSETLRHYWLNWDKYEYHNGLIYRKEPSKQPSISHLQLLLPKAAQASLFTMIHNHLTAGHLGFSKSYQRLKERFWWPGCKSDIGRWCKECDTCQRIKGPTDKTKAPLTQLPVGAPMDRVAADVMGPFEVTPRGNQYVLVITDYFTKWVEAYPMKDQKAPTVATLIGEFFGRLGCPRQFHSDQGPCFRADILKELCKVMDIDKTQTTSYRPQSDGLVERFNLTLQQMLTAFCQKEKRTDWDIAIPYVMLAYRSTPQESTGLSPNMLMLGRKLRTPIDLQYPPPENPHMEYHCKTEYVEWVRRVQREAHELARRYLKQASERQKRNYDLGSRSYDIQVGNWVYVKDHPNKKVKLHMRWKKPHLVIRQLSPVTFEVQANSASPLIVYHVDNLKRSYGCKEAKWNVATKHSIGTQWERVPPSD